MSFLGFGRRGREHEHAHERERPERDWRERTHDWGERRFRGDERFARDRAPGRDIGDDYGPERYGAGHFRGKGPKGYRRSDERIREDVCECLTEDDYIDATNVEVQVRECEVTLTGTVNSREEKRRAEDLIDCLTGVRDVNNNLRVVNEGRMMQRRQEAQTGMRETEQGPRH